MTAMEPTGGAIAAGRVLELATLMINSLRPAVLKAKKRPGLNPVQ